ncbi:hypothetical protein [Actinacidiphila acididurans]|uniref:Uncharacterized protein n=1 Tax=Actinacidiphila acididurans TaxID=2784346 RepID=A0ABS2U4X1_9ACTN|nr:hypothetical protein [Actinacidiphila acididurans]MBM9510677.1 hypothetical protein [Actinacidiphila acididurans]
MTAPRRPRRRRYGPIVLAGWLFADFLLVLALVAMGDQPDPLAVQRSTPRPTATPKPKPGATHKPAGPRAVVRTRFEFQVHGTDDNALVQQIRTATEKNRDRAAAFVLTFGGTRDGTAYARRVNDLLHRARPSMFNRDTATEDFLKLDNPANTAHLWVYFYTATR